MLSRMVFPHWSIFIWKLCITSIHIAFNLIPPARAQWFSHMHTFTFTQVHSCKYHIYWPDIHVIQIPKIICSWIIWVIYPQEMQEIMGNSSFSMVSMGKHSISMHFPRPCNGRAPPPGFAARLKEFSELGISEKRARQRGKGRRVAFCYGKIWGLLMGDPPKWIFHLWPE